MTEPTQLVVSQEAKPCPFCGSPDVELRESITDALIACNNCGARTGLVYLGADDASNAAKVRELYAAWNQRAMNQSAERMKDRAPEVVELRDLLAKAYTAGATDVHIHLNGKDVERDADFAEAANDYADHVLDRIQQGEMG